MIELTEGDILAAEAEALVNTVNCVGVMGRGIALQFKRAFPGNYDAYASACEADDVKPGKMFIYQTGRLTNPRYIVNFPTKRHWRSKSRLSDIEAGLNALVDDVRRLEIESIAIPPLGCGLGRLNWLDVRPLIEDAFASIPDVFVLLYEPGGAPDARDMVKSKKKPNWTKGRAALISLMDRYLGALMDPTISLLEVHKLMYFAQEAGEDLRLNFKKGHYGPYAENLRHVLNHIEGHFISGYADGGEEPDKPLELLGDAGIRAREVLAAHEESRAHFEEVAELVEGFETPHAMELLATVHWVATREDASNPDEAVEKVHAWNARKRQFTDRQIRIGWDSLASKGWIA